MKTAIQQWGNSLALRIPKAFAEQTKMRKGTPVTLVVEKGRVIVTPSEGKEISLKRLLAKVTPENLHPETNWGPLRGREI
ncbi:MAG: AbrB/MazE/SpoVT family DNA-binding domain-containing protein [Limisphaerales bacterium]